MKATTPRPFGPARIVALALIALAARGLAYLRLRARRDAGLGACGRARRRADAQAVQLRHRERQPTRRLRHARRAREPARRRLAADRPAGDSHPGALGAPGRADLPPRGRARPHQHGVSRREPLRRPARRRPRRLPRRRRLGRGSTAPRSSSRAEALRRLPRPRRRSTPYAHAFRSCAERLQADGVDLAGYSLPERVDDLEAARRALGYGRIDLLSESAGTRTAMIYAWRYPKSIHRSVMIGVNPPGNFLWYRGDDRRADPHVRRALRRGRSRAAGGRTTSPRRSRRRRRTFPTTGGSCRSSRATSGSRRSSA